MNFKYSIVAQIKSMEDFEEMIPILHKVYKYENLLLIDNKGYRVIDRKDMELVELNDSFPVEVLYIYKVSKSLS